jgi:calcineurin-like phosphoesterase family protein
MTLTSVDAEPIRYEGGPQAFLCADLHLGHANIIKYSARPFTSLEAHDDALIRNWNAVVSRKDTVYFLGDFAYRSKDAAMNYRRRLNGNIIFCEGNHDKAAHQIRESFSWYGHYKKCIIQEQIVVLCHYPILSWEQSHYGSWMCHGHCHDSMTPWVKSHLPNARLMDVGVDAAARYLSGSTSPLPSHYRPLAFAEVENYMKTKTGHVIDHHR